MKDLVLKEFEIRIEDQLIVDSQGFEVSQMHKDDLLFREGANLKTLYVFNVASKGVYKQQVEENFANISKFKFDPSNQQLPHQ